MSDWKPFVPAIPALCRLDDKTDSNLMRDKRMRMNMFRDASYQEFYLAGLTPALATCDEDGPSSAKEILVHRAD